MIIKDVRSRGAAHWYLSSNKDIHQRADIVGMVMAQVSLKAALEKWGREDKDSVGKEMMQLH